MAGRPHLELGYISRAHGLGGEVGVKTFDPASESLFELERVLVRPREGEKSSSWRSTRCGRPRRRCSSSSRASRAAPPPRSSSARPCSRSERIFEPPDEGEYFQGDLVGLEAYDEQGAKLGDVVELWQTGPVPNLVIRAEGKEELVVPFADEFVPTVDLAAKRLIVRPPQYEE